MITQYFKENVQAQSSVLSCRAKPLESQHRLSQSSRNNCDYTYFNFNCFE